MNTTQRIIVLIGAVLLIGMSLFPAWKYRLATGFNNSGEAYYTDEQSYSFLFKPPHPTAEIVYGRVAVQSFLVILVVGAAVLIFHKRR